MDGALAGKERQMVWQAAEEDLPWSYWHTSVFETNNALDLAPTLTLALTVSLLLSRILDQTQWRCLSSM